MKSNKKILEKTCEDIHRGDIILIETIQDEHYLSFFNRISNYFIESSNIDPRYKTQEIPIIHFRTELEKIRKLTPLIPEGPISGELTQKTFKNYNPREKVVIHYKDQHTNFIETGFIDILNPLIFVPSSYYPKDTKYKNKKHPHFTAKTSFDAPSFRYIKIANLVERIY